MDLGFQVRTPMPSTCDSQMATRTKANTLTEEDKNVEAAAS